MKIKTKLIIGLGALMVIFSATLTFDIYLESQILHVTDYHNFMSIPALSTLDKISHSFSLMHEEVLENIAIKQEVIDDSKYLESYNDLNDLIDEYDKLTWQTQDNGKFFAPDMMRQNMQSFVSEMHESKERYYTNAQNFFSNYNPNYPQTQLIVNQLLSERNNFLEIIKEAIAMETQGKNTEQAKIFTVTENSQIIRNVAIGFALFFTVIISILIIKAVNEPIGKIRDIANQVAKGNFMKRLDESGVDEFQELSKEINKMSEQLECNTKELKKQERLSAIGELSARIAHDVRNPLTSIKVSTELIQSELPENLQESLQERFRVIDRSISRISHQVEDVLDYVRERELKLNSCNISDIIKQSFADVTVPKNVRVNFELSNGNIVCDKDKIETLITNLLINAVQALTEDGQITVKTRIESDSIIITVQDSGPGVPKEIQDKIFEPLFTTKQIGTGLGLASCKKIVEQHKGSITYKNNPSTFTVMLPQLANPLLEKH